MRLPPQAGAVVGAREDGLLGELVRHIAADGPGVLVIFDVPDPNNAPAISGLTVAVGTLQDVKLTRLFTMDEIKQVRQNAVKLRSSYSPPGS